MRVSVNPSRFYAAQIILCALLTFFAPSSPATSQSVPASSERQLQLVPGNLAEIEGAVSEIRKLLDEIETSDTEGGWLTKGKGDYQDKLNSELSKLLDVFSGSSYENARSELVEADLAISTNEERLDRLKSDLRLAPRGNGQLSVIDRAMMREAASGSENAIKRQIAEAEAEIDVARKARDQSIAKFAEEMAMRFGFIMSREQATALLYQVNGYSIVQSKIVFETIVALELYLREGIDEQSTATTVQRYYSVAAVSRLILVRMYQIHLEQYDTRWLPRLSDIAAQNAKLMAATRSAIGDAKSQNQRDQLRNNLEIQERTGEAINNYQNLLEKRRQTTLRGLSMAESEASVAINTLKTLEGVYGLSAEMFSNTSEYETLMELSSPELLPLDGETLDQNYIALNEKLGQS